MTRIGENGNRRGREQNTISGRRGSSFSFEYTVLYVPGEEQSPKKKKLTEMRCAIAEAPKRKGGRGGK